MGNTKHGRQIIDADAHFTIDPVTRLIANDDPKKNTILQGDHNSERFTFKIQRYIDGHDMLSCDNVRVAYINAEVSGRDKKHGTGVYLVSDLALDDTGNYVTCSWLISKNATMYTGVLKFMVIFSCMDGELVKYRWKTNIHEGIIVAPSLDSDMVFEAEYLDVIEQWKDTVKNEFSEYFESSAEQHYGEFKDVLHGEMMAEFEVMKDSLDASFKAQSDSLDEIIDGFDEILRTEITNMDGEIDVLEARMDTFASLPNGTTSGNAELLDIRVGADGTTYASAGRAVREQISKSFRTSGLHVLPDNYTEHFTSLNDAPTGLTYFMDKKLTDEMVSEIPEYNTFGILSTFNYSSTNLHGKYQLYSTETGNFYWRFESGSGSSYNWTEWKSALSTDSELGYLKSSGKLVAASTYADILQDANDAVNNTAYLIVGGITSSMVSNLPVYGEHGILITLAHDKKKNHGKTQIYSTVSGLYHRIEVDDGNGNDWWYDWHGFEKYDPRSLFAVGRSPDVKVSIDDSSHTLTIESNGTGSSLIWSANTFVFMNNISEKTISLQNDSSNTYFVYLRDNELHLERINSYSGKSDDIIIAELFLGTNGAVNRNVWTFGHIEDHVDTLDDRVSSIEGLYNITNRNTCSIFARVCCCGDSYTSGHISTTEGGTTDVNENFAWPSFMTRLTGNEYINCGRSGANVLTWQTDPRGLPKAKTTGKVQAYLVGLGLNDIATGTTRYVELGTSDDIGTSAQTYYGGMSKIVRELNAISPDAMIFIQTMPNASGLKVSYNEAIRTIVAEYSDMYHVHLLDLDEYSHMYQNSSLKNDSVGGHYTAIGYQQFAEILRVVWSEYINNNISKFQNVHLIEYEG